jgi:hypothetical protein
MNRSKTLVNSIIIAFVICSGAISHSQTVSPTQGYPAVTTLETSSNGNTITAIVPSALALDASQFPGTPDICAQINAAYTSPQFTGSIDATAFSGIQECVSNPFHLSGSQPLKQVHLYLNPGVTIVTSVPWFTPQVAHSIEGLVAGNIGQNATTPIGGATIQACGPTISAALVNAGLTWSAGKCSYLTAWTINQFPDMSAAETVVMSFAIPHGPFPTGTYSCILCVGGEGNPAGAPYQEGLGWNQDGDASRISGVKIDLGGDTNIFGYYTMNSQERAELIDTRGGSACGTTVTSQNCADVFYDRTEAPIGGSGTNAGTTRPVIRDFNMAAEGPSACTSCYAIVFEGSDYFVQIIQNSCDTQPLAYVNSVSGSTITLGIVNNGGGNCDNHASNPVCTIKGAPTAMIVTSKVLSGGTNYPTISCSPMYDTTLHVINGFTISLTLGTINNSFFTGGPLFEDINIDPLNPFKNGIWVEGVNNAEISKVHCLNLSDYCVSFGGVSINMPPTAAFTPAGIIRNIDINAGTHGPVTLGYGIDNGQILNSITSGATNLINDLYNGVTLTTGSYGNSLNQYTPGSAPPIIGGVGQQGANAPSALNVNGGTGGTAVPHFTGVGNTGGGINLSAGAGSSGGVTSGSGGAGGALSMNAGIGGTAAAGSSSTGGNGGPLNLTAGNGASGGSAGTGGTGGSITLTPGTGGGSGASAGAPGQFAINCGTLSAAQTTPCLNLTQTWSTSGAADAPIKVTVNNTASLATSRLIDLLVGSTPEFAVNVGGQGYLASSLGINTATCAAGSGGAMCASEGTAPTTATSEDMLYGDSTAHQWKYLNNGGSSGLMAAVMPSPIRRTGLTASISTATLCAASAGACNQAGVYHVHVSMYQSGTACLSNTTNGVSFQLTWTDGNGIAHTTQTIPIISNASNAQFATSGVMAWPAVAVSAWASGDINIDTNGAIVQYGTTYANCTSGTATYAVSTAVTRIE